MNENEFIEELKKIGITVNDDILKKLDIYYNTLIEENKKYNLTTITKKDDVYLKHFYDSLTIIKAITLNNQKICDIGTGAGFPGLILKIFYPELDVTLVDATNKKCQFLEMMIAKLDLKKIKVLNLRAEEYSKKVREQYDIVTSRAVAPIKHLLEYSIPLLKTGGYFIALKSNIDEETKNIEKYHQKLFLTDEKIIKFELPYENSLRTIYIIKKYKETPSKYPRQYAKIKKKEI